MDRDSYLRKQSNDWEQNELEIENTASRYNENEDMQTVSLELVRWLGQTEWS